MSAITARVVRKLRLELGRLLRSGGAGLVATAVDLGSLALLTTVCGVHPRLASWPALLLGGATNFLGHRHFVFRGSGATWPQTLLRFMLAETLALGLNGLLYERTLALFPGLASYALGVRLVTTNLVFLCVSYPLWRRLFLAPRSRFVAGKREGPCF
jgi:putative flippase GtrA